MIIVMLFNEFVMLYSSIETFAEIFVVILRSFIIIVDKNVEEALE